MMAIRKAFLPLLAMIGAAVAADSRAQTVSGPVAGPPMVSGQALADPPTGYVAEEYFFSGEATAYKPAAPLTSDGRWPAEAAGSAPYTSRLVILRPSDPARFNGTVLVEWLNVSGGLDMAAGWSYLRRELVRSGYAFVGISAQKAGIEGIAADRPGPRPPSASGGLKKADRQRYEALKHPGDAFSYDIFTDGARLIETRDLLGPLEPERLIAYGASQSASFLVTYINAVDPLAEVFDGYLLQVRKKTAAPLDGDVFAALQSKSGPFALSHVQVREDVRVPVLTYISEQDLIDPALGLGYVAARQPDSARVRTWEVAGTSHGDVYGRVANTIDPVTASPEELAQAYASATAKIRRPSGQSINAAPQGRYVMHAGLAALNEWVATGNPPAQGEPLRTTGAPPALVVDKHGNALGGVRTPWMDVPTARHTGIAPPGDPGSMLMGLSKPFDAESLARLYPGGRAEYLDKFGAALKRAISAGFILPADEQEILALAAEMYPAAPANP